MLKDMEAGYALAVLQQQILKLRLAPCSFSEQTFDQLTVFNTVHVAVLYSMLMTICLFLKDNLVLHSVFHVCAIIALLLKHTATRIHVCTFTGIPRINTLHDNMPSHYTFCS